MRHNSQLIETQQQNPAFHFSAPHFSAKNLALEEIMAEKWWAEKWDQSFSLNFNQSV
jgi:hypothetical protein